jgi:hypothetical protein
MRYGVCLACCLLLVASIDTRAQGLPAWTPHHGVFAFPDPNGRRLLATAELEQPERLKVALCSSGERLTVQFAHKQAASDPASRQIPANFDRTSGFVFTVAGGGVVKPDATCFLAYEALLRSRVLAIQPAGSANGCLASQRLQYSRARSRAVVHCWTIARVGADRAIALLEFERRGKDALAALVLVDPQHPVFADFPAEFRNEGADLWRVDDGGKISSDVFQIVCVLQTKLAYALGVVWHGSEGRLPQLWTEAEGGRFVEVISDYWYHSP